MPKIIYEANLNSEKICSISIAAWVKFGYFKMNGCIPKIASHCNQVSLYFHSRAMRFNWSYPIHTPAVISIKISQENRGPTVHPQCDAPELAKLVSNLLAQSAGLVHPVVALPWLVASDECVGDCSRCMADGG